MYTPASLLDLPDLAIERIIKYCGGVNVEDKVNHPDEVAVIKDGYNTPVLVDGKVLTYSFREYSADENTDYTNALHISTDEWNDLVFKARENMYNTDQYVHWSVRLFKTSVYYKGFLFIFSWGVRSSIHNNYLSKKTVAALAATNSMMMKLVCIHSQCKYTYVEKKSILVLTHDNYPSPISCLCLERICRNDIWWNKSLLTKVLERSNLILKKVFKKLEVRYPDLAEVYAHKADVSLSRYLNNPTILKGLVNKEHNQEFYQNLLKALNKAVRTGNDEAVRILAPHASPRVET